MGKCKDCVYWSNKSCRIIEIYFEEEKSLAAMEVFVLDDSGLWAQLRTSPDFGCVLFKDRETFYNRTKEG